MNASKPRVRRAGRKTGPKPTFNRSDAVEAAVSLGIDRFTIAGVAEVLSIAPPALYRLFASRTDLLDACLETAAQDMDLVSGVGESWSDALRSYGHEVWRVCEKFPGLSTVIFTYPIAFTHVLRQTREFTTLLQSRGLRAEQALFAIDFIGDTVIATHIAISSMRATNGQGTIGLQAARNRIAEMGSEIADDPAIDPDDSWLERGNLDEKIDFIIRGLALGWPPVPTPEA
jgi:Bacterial regulatory proteins, tetR family.